MINNKKGVGECYILSYFYCLFDDNYKLTQGICNICDVKHNKNLNVNHCWCEKDDLVYDPSWGNEIMTKKTIL